MKPFAYLSLIILFAACGTSREYAYITDAERDSAQAIIGTFATTAHPGDQLYIYVSSQTIESVIPFNEETNKIASGLTGGATATPIGGNVVDGYTVSQSGTIVFPVLGTLSVAGMTLDSMAHYIEERLRDGGFVNDPIVTVSLMNFRVAVIGEVARPQELHISGNRLTIFEALAMCGDLTIHGHRNNITIIRQSHPSDSISLGSTQLPQEQNSPLFFLTPQNVGQIDLTSKELFNSPYYYLQQGDIVYVEPDKSQKSLATRDPNILTYTTLSVRVADLLIRLLNLNRNINRY